MTKIDTSTESLARSRSWWRKPLLTMHVMTSVGVLGADLALLALGVSGVPGADERTIYPAAALVASGLIAPLAVVALGTGLLLGALTPYGLVRYWWVAIKLSITAILTAIVIFVLVPALEQAAAMVSGSPPLPLPDGSRMRFALAPALGFALLAINVALSIYKPRWRLRSAQKNSPARDHAGTLSTQKENL